MKRPIHFIALLLLGAALAVTILDRPARRAPLPVSSSVPVEALPTAPPPALSTSPARVASVAQSVENPPTPSPVVSRSTVTPAADSSPAPTNLPVVDDGRKLFKLAETNPAAALALAAQIDPSKRAGDLMEDLTQQWAGADPLAAAAWAKLNTSGEEQARLLQRVGFVLSQSSPVDAAEFVQAQIPSGPVQDEALMTVVNQWGNKDLAAAAAWVKTFPEGPLQQRAVIELEGIQNYRQALAASQN